VDVECGIRIVFRVGQHALVALRVVGMIFWFQEKKVRSQAIGEIREEALCFQAPAVQVIS